MQTISIRQQLALLLLILSSALPANAQDSARRQRHHDGNDTGRRRWYTDTTALRVRSKDDTAAFFLFGDDDEHRTVAYVHSIEQAYEVLNRVQNGAGLGFGTIALQQQVIDDDSALKMMRVAVRSRNTNITMRNLQLYRQIVLDIQKEILKDRKQLDIMNAGLEQQEAAMRALTRDTVLTALLKDTLALNANKRKLRRLQGKWRRADSLLQSSFDTLTLIRTEAADNAIAVSELLNRIDNRLRRNGIAAMGKEYNYLWEDDSSGTVKAMTPADIAAAKANERKVLRYYVKQRQGKILLFLLCLGAFTWWITRAYRNLRRNSTPGLFETLRLDYLETGRIAAAIVAVCCFIPFFDLYAPSSFIELIQLSVLLTLSYIFYRRWPRRLFIYWTLLVLLFASYFMVNGMQPGFALRCLLIALNIMSIVLAWLFGRALKENVQLRKLVKTALVIHILLNLAAVYANVYGRVTIAQTLRNAGIYGLTQMVALTVCLQILKESVLLQIQSSRLRRGILRPFDTTQVTGSLRIPLLVVAVLLWLIMFTVNMNIYAPIRELLLLKLNTPVNIGNAAFTPGSVVLFFAIIWVAHLLQRYTGYIFGDIGFEDDPVENKEQRSKMLISKLVILTIGYFLAVAASGLPVDKITIVLGALGVGIGLGLQNIVSNFISGIILIFDRPLQIGDSIEVGNKAGKVKEIGMRSSTLLTPEGAEVIIPNGDILSQQITNWTLSNNYRRLELNFGLKTERSKDEILPIVTGIVQSSSLVYDEREPVALIDHMQEGEMGLKLLFWCNDIYKADQVKSELRYLLYTKLRELDIRMT